MRLVRFLFKIVLIVILNWAYVAYALLGPGGGLPYETDGDARRLA